MPAHYWSNHIKIKKTIGKQSQNLFILGNLEIPARACLAEGEKKKKKKKRTYGQPIEMTLSNEPTINMVSQIHIKFQMGEKGTMYDNLQQTVYPKTHTDPYSIHYLQNRD